MSAATRKKIYFTVQEANRRLPLVRAIVEDIVDLFRDINERRERLAAIRQSPGKRSEEPNPYSEEVEQMEAELEKDVERFRGFVDELQELGVELKDAVTGLADFPTRIDGRDAYLCWRLGEQEIGYWHELETGFAGRQSLLENSVFGDTPADGDTPDGET